MIAIFTFTTRRFCKSIEGKLSLYILIPYLLIILLLSCGNDFTKADLLGDWEAKNNNFLYKLRFNGDGTVELKSFDMSQVLVDSINGNYYVNFLKKPIALSIYNIPQYSHPLHTIIKFNGIDSFIMAEFSSKLKLRPIIFESKYSKYFRSNS